MEKQIVIKFDAPDNLRRALSRYRHGKKAGLVTKKAVKDWALQLIEQASLDLQLKLAKEGQRVFDLGDPQDGKPAGGMASI